MMHITEFGSSAGRELLLMLTISFIDHIRTHTALGCYSINSTSVPIQPKIVLSYSR